MRLCILADASAPVDPKFPGHGLGQATYTVANGLHQRGHDVTLIAVEGSQFAGTLITVEQGNYEREPQLPKIASPAHKERAFDAFLDNSHVHHLSDLFPDLPVVNVYHDMFQPP